MQIQKNDIYAGIGTLIVMALVMLWLSMSYLEVVPSKSNHPLLSMTEVVPDEVFVDVVPEPPVRGTGPEAAPAYNPVPASNQSEAAPTTGHDLKDNGPAGKPAPTVTSSRPSSVKEEKPKGPTPAEIAAREEQRLQAEAQRRANAALSNAFDNAKGTNNTNNKGATPGNSGRPDGQQSLDNRHGVSVSGRGSGGWGLPKGTSVAMSEPGKIVFQFTITPEGDIRGLNVVAAKSSAYYAGNSAVISKLKNEITSYIASQVRSGKRDTETRNVTITYVVR